MRRFAVVITAAAMLAAAPSAGASVFLPKWAARRAARSYVRWTGRRIVRLQEARQGVPWKVYGEGMTGCVRENFSRFVCFGYNVWEYGFSYQKVTGCNYE